MKATVFLVNFMLLNKVYPQIDNSFIKSVNYSRVNTNSTNNDSLPVSEISEFHSSDKPNKTQSNKQLELDSLIHKQKNLQVTDNYDSYNLQLVNVIIGLFLIVITLTLVGTGVYLYHLIKNINKNDFSTTENLRNKFNVSSNVVLSKGKSKGSSRFKFLKSLQRKKQNNSDSEEEASFVNTSMDKSSLIEDMKNKYASMSSLDIIDEHYEENQSVKSS